MNHNGQLPDSLDELTEGTDEKPPLLEKKDLFDSWGQPFAYSRQVNRFTVASSGEDMEMGTEDDITNR